MEQNRRALTLVENRTNDSPALEEEETTRLHLSRYSRTRPRISLLLQDRSAALRCHHKRRETGTRRKRKGKEGNQYPPNMSQGLPNGPASPPASCGLEPRPHEPGQKAIVPNKQDKSGHVRKRRSESAKRPSEKMPPAGPTNRHPRPCTRPAGLGEAKAGPLAALVDWSCEV